MPGEQTWPRLQAAAALLAAAVYVVVFRRLDVPWMWVAFWSAAVASLALLGRWPALGLGVYAAMFYGTPRYTSLFEQLAASNALHIVVALTVAGTILSLRTQTRRLVLRSPLLYVAAATAAWLCVAAVVPRASDVPPSEAVRHSPVYLVHAVLLLGVSTQVMGRASAVFQFVIPFCVGLGVRGGWQGVDGIRLEGDIGPMSVMALPLCLVIARLPGRAALRLAAVVASAGAIALIGLTYNRASAVAFVATLVALAWGFRRHVWILLFVGVTAIGAAWWLANSPFAERFQQVRRELLGESSGSVSERLELWRAGRAMTADYPLLGVGIGHYPSELALYAPHLEGKAAHNSYIQMAAETGVPGAALYVALFAGAVIVAGLVARRHRADATGLTAAAVQASLIGYLAAGAFISRHDMVLAYILVGWIAALDLSDRPSPGSGHSFD